MTRYVKVSVAVGTLNFTLATGLTYLGMNYMWATGYGLTLHAALAFFWLRRDVFNRSDLHALPGIARALVVEVGGFGIVLFVTYVCVDMLGFYYLVSRSISVVFVVVWDYIMHSSFTFKTNPFA